MDQEEENKYVSQLQEVFTSCDTTGTGYLDKEELTDLCHKLHLGEHLSLLLQTLLGNDHFARVNFDEFKEGFVAVLSSTIDISISEDESSYLEPVIPDEVKPKYVKGKKRYGRRTRPEREAAENEANKFLQEQHHVNSKRKSQLRRSSSLESVESLKSDEEAECAKETQNENFESQGQLRTWNTDIFDSPRRNSSPCSDMTEHQVRDIWEELGIDPNGYLNLQELAAVCKNIGLKDLTKEELQDLFTKLDRDGDGRVSFEEFQLGLFSHSPIASTPLKQRRPWTLYQLVEDTSHKTPSLLSNCGGFHLFSSIDDGTGFGNAEQILVIWEEEGLEDSKDILMSLDFSLDNQVNLVELTTALDNELIATKNKIHFAALASYKHELHYQHAQIEQVIRERDKVKQDLERAEKRNLQLADEVDDHTSVMETLNESKIRDLEQEYRQKLSVIRSELESEREQFIQQTDQHRNKLETDLANYQMEEAFLREKLNLSLKENSRLQKEMIELVGKLSESESQVLKLQNNVDHMMKDRRLADPHHVELFNQEEKFAEIIKEYEIQCRELRDRNDELQIQLETLRSQVSERKYSRLLAKMKDNKLLHHRAKEKIHHSHQHNDSPGKQSLSSKLRRSVSAVGVKGVGTCESDCSPMNMEVELTKHQVKEQQQEIQDLKIQLETKVNYYERELELMKTNFEKERKDTEQSFKIEISELEEQKADLEELNAKYQEVIDGLKEQLSKSAHYQEIEKKFEKEKVEMEQHYAKEIAELGQRMTHEKEQLEDELRRQNQHEVQAMRDEAEEQLILRLAKIEDQYKKYYQSLLQQNHTDKTEILKKHEVEIKTLEDKHVCERTRWEESKRALLMQCKKDQLKMEEKQNEEQARICKIFALEKEKVESHYKMLIDNLTKEIEHLNASLIEDHRLSGSMIIAVNAEQQPAVKGQPFSLITSTSEANLGNTGEINQQQGNVQQIICPDSIINEKEDPVEAYECVKQNEVQNVQYQQVLTSLKLAEERLSLLTQTEESTTLKLREMERLVSSLRAQLQDETKAKEMLLKELKCFEEKETLLSSKLKIKEEECQLSEAKEKELASELQESACCIQKQGAMLEQVQREKDELEKQVSVFTQQVAEYEHKLLRQNELGLTTQLELAGFRITTDQNVCKSQQENVSVDNTILVDELVERNAVLSLQLRNLEEELNTLQRKLKDTEQHFQNKEEEAIRLVQGARQELESEKNALKEKLFELEDLVRELEKEPRASQDDRLEFSRLYEDNSILRSKAEHLQLEVYDLEDKNMMHRKQVEELKSTNDEIIGNLEELSKQTQDYQKELALLDAKRMELSATISHLTAQEEASQESLQHLNLKLREVSEKKEMVAAENEQLQEKLSALEEEKMQQSLDWEREKEQLAQELQMCKEKNDKYQEELSLLVTERMELSATISELRAGNHECLLQINSRVREVTQLKEEVTAEKKNLQEKLKALEEQNVHQNSAWEAEKEQLGHELLMYKEENQKYKEELNLLDTERQELGAIISDLKAHNEANQESIRHMTSRLEEVAEQKAKMAAEIRQLQEQIKALETEAFEQQSKWEKERELTEEGLQFCKVENQKYQDELDLLDTERAQLSATILDLREQCVQNQEEIQQVTRKLNDLTQQGEGATAEIVRLQETLAALEEEKIQQNSEWETNREQLEQGLQMSEKKIQDLILNHEKEMENLLSGLDESQQQIFIMEALQEEVSSLRQEKQSMEEKCQHITSQLKETKDQMTQMQQKEFNFKQTQAEYQSLQLNLSQVREKLEESQDQLQEANTKLALVESQHMREFQQLKEKASNSVPKEQLSQLQKRLQEEHQKVLQDKLRFHAEQTNRQLAMQQEEYEKVLRRMEERMEDVEMNLKNIRMMLQEKVNQLKEQLEKNAKSDLLLKDLYVENAQLMKALQVTEQRQKSAEKKNYLLEEKITALNKVIRNIAPASLVV
ncbi:ninein-like protein isoform X1 [Bombina bombina]|uniref:ninein-like protein isoform X1 n=1 Tax=Bombina bombina TaxID=8345 RepID=UPI00235A9B7C|nr:ninein-like protein isoform X1 [Bombina bombina]